MTTTDRADVPLYWKTMAVAAFIGWVILILGLPATLWVRAIVGTWDTTVTDALWATWAFGIVGNIALTVAVAVIGDGEGYF